MSAAASTSRQEPVLVSFLKDCAKHKDLRKGCIVHADCIKRGLIQTNVCLGSAIINMYAKCGALAKGQAVFEEIPARNVVLWNTLITGYAQHGHGRDALHYFEKMKIDGLSPNAVTFLSVLRACGSLKAAQLGSDIHAEIMRQGLLEKESALGNSLVDMYAKSGVLKKAQEVFDYLPRRNVVTWNTLIGGYANHGQDDKAFDTFKQMQKKGISPSMVSFLSILKACGSIGSTQEGIDIHADILRRGLLEEDNVLGNSLVDMYAKCGALSKAQDVFEKLPKRTLVTWNALLTGYCQYGQSKEALTHFQHMQQDGLSPDATTFACILQACGSMGDAGKGKEIHDEITRQGFLEEDYVLRTALVDMYINCGKLVEAQDLFDNFGVNDIISWTTLISGYCQYGYGDEALNCLQKMKRRGLCPDSVTFSCILKACSSLGASEQGEIILAEIISEGVSGKTSELTGVWTALVDMYVKCGALGKAQAVFDKLPNRDVVTWTALMAGYARAGRHSSIFELFNKMLRDGVEPNPVTFAIVLKACSHLGLLNEGWGYFNNMRTIHGISPTPQHYACMVDLFGHAGYFNKAMGVIKEMPASNCFSEWLALLGACEKWGNVNLANLAFEHTVQVDQKLYEVYA